MGAVNECAVATEATAQLPTPPASPDSAGELIRLAQLGDQSAFAEVYLDAQPRLLRYAMGLVGQDAEDITAEAWLQIARDLQQFHGDRDAFRGWAARIVRNRALDHIRARDRRPVHVSELSDILDHPDVQDAADLAEENLGTSAALDLIASLPQDQAEAILLRTIVGLDAKTAGQVLGKRAGAVRAAAHRGLKTLQRQLAVGHPTHDRAPDPGVDGNR